MHDGTEARLRYWARLLVSILIVYGFVGLLVEAAVPHLLPHNALTTHIGDSAKAGIFAVWFYLIWRIFVSVRGLYGADSVAYMQRTSVWRILLNVLAAYALAAFCFSVLYLYLDRNMAGAFSAHLTLGDALYFSIVTMTTTGYGDIAPKSGWAKVAVCLQIMFGVLYNVLFFSIFAGLAGRKHTDPA